MQEALILLLLLACALGAWYWGISGRERVLAISAEICRDLQMQRLDDSVALTGLRLIRLPRFAIERLYEFEFSTDGSDRRRGHIVLHGLVLDRARVELPDGPLLINVGTRGGD